MESQVIMLNPKPETPSSEWALEVGELTSQVVCHEVKL